MPLPPSQEQARLLTHVRVTTQRIHLVWRNLTTLYGSAENVALLRSTARGLFATVQRVLGHDVVLALCSLTEGAGSEKRPNASIERLLNTREKLLGGPDLALRTQLEELRTSVEHVRRLRNRRVAHADLLTILDLHEEPLVVPTRSEVADALAKLRKLVNAIETAAGIEVPEYESISQHGDGQAVLDVLSRAIVAGIEARDPAA